MYRFVYGKLYRILSKFITLKSRKQLILSICIVANRVTDEFEINDEMQKRAGLVASRAVAILHKWDKKKAKHAASYLYPSLLSR